VKRGDRVVRVSLKSDLDGKIGDAGIIERIHHDDAGKIYAFTVAWENKDAHPFLLAHRVVTPEAWAAEQRRKATLV
jgi:hypothetical protein